MAGPSPDTLAVLRTRRSTPPAWWTAARLGIFVHWVPASVPAFAPRSQGIVELMQTPGPAPIGELPYTEWYQNSLRFPDSSVARHHRETYGDRPYEAFADDFVAGLDQWDPAEWARRFKATGAGYVVLVAKHHDGWCLWPSEVVNPNRPNWFSARDLVGELAAAVRSEGMRFGVYYSGGYDWTFDDRPIGVPSDVVRAIPRGDYIAYATAQVDELIERYRPSALWGDIAWPSTWPELADLFARYFRAVPDGVVNDRWMTGRDLDGILKIPGLAKLADAAARRTVAKQGIIPPKPKFSQFRTPEYSTLPEIDLRPWESTRGMDHGFGYNRFSTDDDHLSRDDLIGSLVATVARGGNLLLNVGPRGEDAQIPELQTRRLDWLAEWMGANGDALVGSRPWVTDTATSPEGRTLWFTTAGDRFWVLVGEGEGATVTVPLLADEHTRVGDAGGEPLPFTSTDAGLLVTLPEADPAATTPFRAISVDHAGAHPGIVA